MRTEQDILRDLYTASVPGSDGTRRQPPIASVTVTVVADNGVQQQVVYDARYVDLAVEVEAVEAERLTTIEHGRSGFLSCMAGGVVVSARTRATPRAVPGMPDPDPHVTRLCTVETWPAPGVLVVLPAQWPGDPVAAEPRRVLSVDDGWVMVDAGEYGHVGMSAHQLRRPPT